MSIWKRIFGSPETVAPIDRSPPDPPAPVESITPTSVVAPAAVTEEPALDAAHIDDIVRVEEVGSAEFYAGDLFRRRFGGDPPDYPKHYVAFYRAGRTQYLPVGYIHYTAFEDTFLCGGMVIDDRLYRRMPAPHRKLIKEAGGIAEKMLRDTFARLAHAPAIWGHVGNKQAEEVDRRVGFVHTHDPHVMVVWNRDLSDEDKSARLARVLALGPF